jgi:HYR domain
MRTKLRSKVTLLFMVLGMLLAIPAVAYADNVVDDVVVGGNDTIQAGGSTSINYKILNQNRNQGDTINQCNAADGTRAVVNLTVPAVVTASSTSLQFSGCDTPQAVQFSSSKVGNYNITASVTDPGGGVYNTSDANFTLVVNDACPNGDTSGNLQDGKCTANTPPVVSVSGVTNGDSYEHGAVPAAGCNVTDAEDTNESANPVKDSSGLNSYGLGSEKVTCTYTDGGGVTKSASATYNIVDTTKPNIAAHGDVTAEATGPNGAEVTYTAPTANDAVYGSVDVECLPASGTQFDLGDTMVTCTATDGSGNEATPTTFKVTVADTTKPDLNLPANITEEATGPNGNVVNFNATASDLVSGSVNVDCSPASGDTFAIATTTVNCSATDAAGNEATGSFTVKVQDTIAPSNIQFVGNINDGGSFFFGDVPTQPTCTATDGGSGLNSAGCVVSGYSTAVGTHTLKATATDKAGNTATKEISYTVKPYTLNGFYQPIDMNDTVNTVKNGSTVPVKFELFKGATELTSTSAVTSIKSTPISCATLSGDPEDAIETVATGGTSLRYDTTAGQFIYNWTTPKGATQVGKCYSLTMTAADSSTITAYFELK